MVGRYPDANVGAMDEQLQSGQALDAFVTVGRFGDVQQLLQSIEDQIWKALGRGMWSILTRVGEVGRGLAPYMGRWRWDSSHG